jgi:cathepsin F
MTSRFVALLVILAAVAAWDHILMPRNVELTDMDIVRLFNQFRAKYNRVYTNQEEVKQRFDIFKNNMLKAQELNKQNPHATFGPTKFSDISPEEFRRTHLMKPKTPAQMQQQSPKHMISLDDKDLLTAPLPDSFDWRELGAVTDVKDQGQCGSCWAFSTTGAIEAANFIATKKLVSLSEQNLVDCDHVCSGLSRESCDNGCDGGLMENAMEYVIRNRGIDTEESYPYYARDDDCHFKNSTIGAKISAWARGSHNETLLAAQLMKYGSISIGMNADSILHYQSGILNNAGCSQTNIDHGILLVAFETSDEKVWTIKNSWGSGWGESGYFRAFMGYNVCGLASGPVIAIV